MAATSLQVPTSVGDCIRPLRLIRQTTDMRSGEVGHGEFSRRCQSRLEAKCPPCSKLYRDDAFAVLRGGLMDETNKPKPMTMITLTAPGSEVFGKVHSRNIKDNRVIPCACKVRHREGDPVLLDSRHLKNGVVLPCRCKVRHREGDPILGTPIDVSTYNYQGAADFNAHASRLFAVTMQKLSRILGRKLIGVRVAEFQSRGILHFHAILLGCMTQRTLELVIRGGTNLRTGRHIAAATSGDWMWGPQCKADVIAGGDQGRAISYMVKVVSYALKDTAASADANSEHGKKMAQAGGRSCKCGLSLSECVHGDPFGYVKSWACDSNGVVEKCTKKVPYQSRQSKYPCRRHRMARNGWGFRGHVLAKSKTWPLTFATVRAKRGEWCKKNSTTSPLPDHLLVSWQVFPHRGLGSLYAYATSPPN
jgi:hypothetical protein